MSLLAEQPNAVFLGQSVACEGRAMRSMIEHLPPDKLVELPVFEQTQMGMCTGIALAGGLPISIYPRINFLLEALPRLVQELDKLPLYSGFRPRVIIRTAIATPKPLNPGPQHLGDYSLDILGMLRTVRVVDFHQEWQIIEEYRLALKREGPTLLVERMDRYDV